MVYDKTLVVNLFGGPGTGKSTIRAGIFYDLKSKYIDCEEVTEYAKDLVWESREKTIKNQIYIFGKQHHRIFRLLNQVEVIITDSPLLLSPIYDIEKRNSFKEAVMYEHNKLWSYNLFLSRKKKYIENGRYQTEDKAKEKDDEIIRFLIDNKILFFVVDGNEEGKSFIVNEIIKLINK